jgi:hypothetical protein
MKQFRLIFLTLASVCISIPQLVFSQFTVKRVVSPETVNTAQDGFYYSLPKTVLKIDLVVEKIQRIKGPLSDYCEEYLGVADFIKTNGTQFRLLNAEVEPIAEPDKDQLFYVQFPAEKSKDEQVIAFQLSSLGTLLAFDDAEIAKKEPSGNVDQTIIFTEGDDGFDYFADYDRKRKIDTITRKITIDTVSIERFIFKTSWVDKSTEEKANEAALQITNIREARFNLLTGYQEVNYGESMKYMDRQLLKMEKQYLELFLGKELKSVENHTVYYVPEKGNPGGVILNSDGGKSVEVAIKPSGNSSLLPEKPFEKPDQVYYRIPEITTIEVKYDGEILYRKNLPVSQLGAVAAAPLGKAKTQFDPETGTMTRIIRQ